MTYFPSQRRRKILYFSNSTTQANTKKIISSIFQCSKAIVNQNWFFPSFPPRILHSTAREMFAPWSYEKKTKKEQKNYIFHSIAEWIGSIFVKLKLFLGLEFVSVNSSHMQCILTSFSLSLSQTFSTKIRFCYFLQFYFRVGDAAHDRKNLIDENEKKMSI